MKDGKYGFVKIYWLNEELMRLEHCIVDDFIDEIYVVEYNFFYSI